MDPSSTQRFRRFTGVAAACWAAASIGFSLLTLWGPRHELTLPIHCSFSSGSVALVDWSTPEAREAGVARGDRLVEIDGRRVWAALRQGSAFLQPQVRNEYRIEKSDGGELLVSLLPAPASFDRRSGQTLIHLGLLVVALLYL